MKYKSRNADEENLNSDIINLDISHIAASNIDTDRKTIISTYDVEQLNSARRTRSPKVSKSPVSPNTFVGVKQPFNFMQHLQGSKPAAMTPNQNASRIIRGENTFMKLNERSIHG